jgi:hypothetical protein
MAAIGRLLFKVFGLPVFMWIGRKIAANIRLAVRKAKRKELEQELKEADTPEERDHAAQDIINHFNNSDK